VIKKARVKRSFTIHKDVSVLFDYDDRIIFKDIVMGNVKYLQDCF
jgi:hypothetical protein